MQQVYMINLERISAEDRTKIEAIGPSGELDQRGGLV